MSVNNNYSPPAFNILLKPRGSVCNLACKYCYFLSKEDLYPNSEFRMQAELLEDFTRQYINGQRTNEVVFSWQGGEPTLMGLDFYEQAVIYQQKHRKPGMKILNTLQTNGTTLDPEWCQFFREHNFLVGISVDGPKEIHDVYRVDKGEQPTFDDVMKGLNMLKEHNVEFNILTTVHAANAQYPLEVYRFLRDEIQAKYLQFIPIVERDNNTGFQEGTRVTSRSVTGTQYGNFLIEIFDEWVLQDVGEIFIQLFDIALNVWAGLPSSLCVFSKTCGLALAMEHNGDIYSCDHYVEPSYLIGNIQTQPLKDMVASHQQRQFGVSKNSSLPRYCQECEVRFICNGGCPKNRISKTPSGEYGLNYLCAGYKAFFNHINHPMNLMVDLLRAGQAPADVMGMLNN